MIGNKKILAVIPARAGSKGLRGKNIKLLNGKPLIYWTIAKAKKSKLIDKIIVSTDSREIANVAEKYGIEIPFLRPRKYASDKSPTFDAVKHVIDFLRKTNNMNFDYIILLEPTSPLRENSDIDNIISKLHNNSKNYDSLVSVGEINVHPSTAMKLSGLRMKQYCEGLKVHNRRQDNTPAYFPFGGCYIVKMAEFLKEKTFYTSKCTFYKIKRYQCYEIDDIYDFLAVENIMKYEGC